MLAISKDQFSMLEVAQKDAFLSRICAFLATRFEEAGRSPLSELKSEVAAQVENAEKYGLETERQFVSYVLAAKHLGSDFDTELPSFHEMLTSPTLEPAEKEEALEQMVMDVLEQLSSEAKE